MTRLTDIAIRKLNPGSKAVAHGGVKGLMYVPSKEQGRGKWVLRYTSPNTGKRRDMGLGRYPEVSLATAASHAFKAQEIISAGNDPIDLRNAEHAALRAEHAILSFRRAAERVHQDVKVAWKNYKHIGQWINTLRDYVFPKLGDKRVSDLTPSDFAEVLKPIWLDKPETATRVKQRCHMIMKWCWAHGLVQGNPVDVVDHLLPRQPSKRERVVHQPAMPWRLVPSFVADSLQTGAPNVTRSLLEFVILTAARSGEARAMRWDEVDFEGSIWTVPADRMKAKVEHRVPLSDAAIRLLERQRERDRNSPLVFPAPRGGILSDMVLTKFLRDQNAASDVKGRVATAHGFRSSFRDWASESGYPRDLAEKALAHTVSNKVEAAYHRTDLLDQRRPMMEAWAAHVMGQAVIGNVVPLRVAN